MRCSTFIALHYTLQLFFLLYHSKFGHRYPGSLGFVYGRLRKAKLLRLLLETESDLLYGEYADFVYDYIFLEDALHNSILPITTTLL